MTQRTIFDEEIIRAWWKLMEEGIHDGIIQSGTDYLVIDALFYVSFHQVYEAYLQRFLKADLSRELLLPPPQMRKALLLQKDFLFENRKRLGPTVNVRALVFRWNRQVRLPARKLRKVS